MNEERFREKLTGEIINTARVIPLSLQEALDKAAGQAQGIEKTVLEKIVKNYRIASQSDVPVCQDTGIFEIWFFIGKDAGIKGVNFNSLADKAVAEAHKKGKLRRSMSGEIRGVVHVYFTEGRGIETVITARGFGSENYTFHHNLKPGASKEEIKKTILEDIKEADAHPCPPYVLGIGLGGTASAAVELSALALTEINFSPSGFEKEIMDGINRTKTGAGGLGGKFSALGIKIKKMPPHIAGLQMCVHAGCWCNRVRKFHFEEN